MTIKEQNGWPRFTPSQKTLLATQAGGVAGAGAREVTGGTGSFGGASAADGSGASAATATGWRSCHSALLLEISRMDTLQHCMAWL